MIEAGSRGCVRSFLKLCFCSILLAFSLIADRVRADQGPCQNSLLEDSSSPADDQNTIWTRSYPDLEKNYRLALGLTGRERTLPVLSIVIPAFREEKRIGASITEIRKFFDTYSYPVEILIRVEKSPDQTVAVAERAAEEDPRVKIFPHAVQRGKGYAVRQGILDASGEYVLFMDADLSTPLPEVFNFLSRVAQNPSVDVWIGDRKHPDSEIETHQSVHRMVMGSMFRSLTKTLLGSYGLHGVNDTQCGFKLFTQNAAQKIFGLARVDGFAFDIETLLLAAELRMRVESVPIFWRDDPRSTVHPILDPLKMLRDVVRMHGEIHRSLAADQQSQHFQDGP